MENFHEDFKDHYTPPEISADAFGFTLGGILSAIGLLKGVFLGWWIAASVFLFLGIGIIAIALTRPVLLENPKAFFSKIAPVVARVMNPMLMGVIYIVCFIPAGLILKTLKRDPLNRSWNPYITTYWVKREKHGLPDPMKYQF